MIPLVLVPAMLVFRALGALGVRRFASWPVSAAHGMAVMLLFTASAHFVPADVTAMPNHADMVRMVPPLWQRIPEQVLYLAIVVWVARTADRTATLRLLTKTRPATGGTEIKENVHS